MQLEKEIMIKHCLEKAEQALLSANMNIENNWFSDAQNRLYYAVFYCVLALGYLDGFVTTTSGDTTAFNSFSWQATSNDKPQKKVIIINTFLIVWVPINLMVLPLQEGKLLP